jgi:hypothetical protein
MQYGEPTTSAGVKSGNARRKLSTSASFRSAIATPAGLRSQTPISQTASNPSAAIASHSLFGTSARSIFSPRRVRNSSSHTHVLIS